VDLLLPVCKCLPHAQAKGVSFDVVFGQLLGTTALVCLWPLFLSFLPYRALRKLFPPIVTGVLCATDSILHRECHAPGAQQVSMEKVPLSVLSQVPQFERAAMFADLQSFGHFCMRVCAFRVCCTGVTIFLIGVKLTETGFKVCSSV
jgi:hypothetical protein